MCGFAGEFVFGSGGADLRCACSMAARLTHRGPDEDSSFLSDDGRCAIGFRRLAVIDPAGSHQPMSTDDGRTTVAFNGEIYNFKELREELSGRDVTFRTAGDTEVLLHLYGRNGVEMVQHLEGMFAFVLYDCRAGRLLLARDRLGQKPLWYAALPDRIVFASEAKALLVHPKVSEDWAPVYISHYVSMGYIPCPHSVWSAIRKLPPAHTMTAADSLNLPAPYWAPRSATDVAVGADLPEVVRNRLARAVEARMVADVPLGALLSGGIDSAIVVALMCKAAGGDGGVRTFTAGFEDADFDERQAAALVAEHCGSDHTELLVKPPQGDVLDTVVAMYDEPFADSSALPTWLICKAAREHVTVALTGDGGDEVFGGYDRYRAIHLAENMSPFGYLATRLGAMAARPFASHDERSRLRRFIRFVRALPNPPAMQYFIYRRLFGPKELKRLFTEEFAEKIDLYGPEEWFCELYGRGEFEDEVSYAQRHDVLTYLPDDLLVKADMASMAASLELRSPMLDHEVVNMGLAMPAEWKVDRKAGKKILREAFGTMLPESVFKGPKRGFGVPLGRWLREGLRETMCQTLLDRGFLQRGIFKEKALAGLINDHLSGRDDHRHRLWALMVLARWLARQD